MDTLRKNYLLFLNTDLFRVLILIALTVYIYHPFFNFSNMGAGDAQFYQYMLHDAIIQYENGFFPNYVGQSLFIPDGIRIALSPYYLWLGLVSDGFSFGLLSPLLLQHLTIFFSAILAASILYFSIRKIAPLLHWQAVFIAFLYVSNPGVMGLIYHIDAYLSFMAIPFVPLVFYGLIRIYKKNDTVAFVLTALGLAAIWLAHAPIAMWTSSFAVIFCVALVILKKRSPVPFFGLTLIFVGLCFWQFFSIYSLGPFSGSELWTGGHSKVDLLIKQLLVSMPDVFLPLSVGKQGLFFLQLGYSMWFIIILAFVGAFSASGGFLSRIFIVLIGIIVILLYPIPYIGKFFWSMIPEIFIDINNTYPNQRFYVILAAIGCFVGALSLQEIVKSGNAKAKWLLTPVLAILFIWSIHQANFFIAHGNAVKLSNESTTSPKDSWRSTDNISLQGFGLPKAYLKDLPIGAYDSRLKSKLLDHKMFSIDEYDNERSVINKCLVGAPGNNPAKSDIQVTLPNKFELSEPISISAVNLHPTTHYLLCADISVASGDVLLQLLNSRRSEEARLGVKSPSNELQKRQKVGLPFYFNGSDGVATSLFDFRMWAPGTAQLTLYNFGITSYSYKDLPIVVQSYTPYRATVNTTAAHKFIEIQKLFLPGYIAKINNVEVPIIESARKTIILPLSNLGVNSVELSYVGTPGMRWAFYFSALAWFLVLAFLVVHKFVLSRERSNASLGRPFFLHD